MHFDSSISNKMTWNDAFNLPMGNHDSNTAFIDGLFSQMTSVSRAQSSLLDPNNQNQTMEEFPGLPMLQGEPMNNLHTGFTMSNHVGLVDCDASNYRNETQGRNTITDSSSDYSDALNSAFATSVNCGYNGILGSINNKWEFDRFLACSEVAGEIPGITGFQPFQLMGNVNLNPNGWTSSRHVNLSSDNLSGSKFNSEISTSLSTCQPSILVGTSVPDQCLEISSSAVTHHPLNERSLSLRFGPHRSVQFSEILSGSRYLFVIQEILAEISRYSLENLDQMNYHDDRIRAGAKLSYSSSCLADRGYMLRDSEGDGGCTVQMDLVRQRRVVEANKKQLMALLQEVDERYNQCLDEIHTVISAFHAATELDPHIHARFALLTVSSSYKNLRERISHQILKMGRYYNRGGAREEERSFEASFIQKQWALQQLRRKDHQLWRPQRGLPERSVSVLRAWMFQNFLHPYPKDTEKHLLAVKSGLTRSQVSNWFINARVRLWKPMIEEMYAEMNRRKGRRNNEETDSSHRSRIRVLTVEDLIRNDDGNKR
ncbi:hypothetical protein U1Q18_018895 [Sarracenia purpurea var. burkii]